MAWETKITWNEAWNKAEKILFNFLYVKFVVTVNLVFRISGDAHKEIFTDVEPFVHNYI